MKARRWKSEPRAHAREMKEIASFGGRGNVIDLVLLRVACTVRMRLFLIEIGFDSDSDGDRDPDFDFDRTS